MSDAPLMLGVSGLRGIVGESLTPEVAVQYAGAFGQWLSERFENPEVVLAADGREGWKPIHSAVHTGLVASGCDVHTLGVATTPTVGKTVDSLGVAAGVVITASHNPSEWNGIKLLVSESDPSAVAGARAPTATEASAIIATFRSGDIWAAHDVPQTRSANDITDAAFKHVFVAMREAPSWPLITERGFRVVVDSVNASGVEVARELGEQLGLQFIQLHGSRSGIFPHTPEPTAENLSGEGGLCGAVPGLKADVGFAQDPDADRLAIIDETGMYIGEEYTLALCALSLLSVDRDREADRLLVANLSTSRMIDDIAAAHNARVVRTPVGEANVVEAMKKLKGEGHDVVLGGEGNGGVIWPDVVYVRDSIGSMALVLSLMARTGKTVSQLVADIDALVGLHGGGGEPYAILKTKRPLAKKEDAAPAVAKIAEHFRSQPGVTVDTQDGVRVDWPDRKAWVHVRASNTEPIMRLIAEAPGAEEAQKILDEVGAMVN